MLVVVRTITTVAYLFDVLAELLRDTRIQTLFTQNGDDSAFEAPVADAVRELGGRMLPWSQAVATPFDLAISASHYGGLDQLCSPLLILPHGPGYAKTISRPDDGRPPVPTLKVPAKAAPSTVMLTHSEQQHQWQEDRAAGVHTVVVGDPVFDRLQASLSDRRRYRTALGLRDDQKLVVVSSTWGSEALLARKPSLPSDLLAELPSDEYAVAALLHANIWVGHGAWQVRLWLGRACEAGLRLMPCDDGSWRSVIVASDIVIGDHGSVTFYAAALGQPVALGAFGEAELVKETPIWKLGKLAPCVEPDHPMRGQLEKVGFEFNPSRYGQLAAGAFANQGKALGELREVVYRQLDLDPPSQPVSVDAVALPTSQHQEPRAFVVLATLQDAGGDARVSLERYPAALEPDHTQAKPGRHLLAFENEASRGLRESAATLILDARSCESEAQAGTRAIGVLEEYPGCQVAAVVVERRRCVFALRDRGLLLADLDIDAEVGLIASSLYAWAVAAPEEPPPQAITALAGERRVSASFKPFRRNPQPEPT